MHVVDTTSSNTLLPQNLETRHSLRWYLAWKFQLHRSSRWNNPRRKSRQMRKKLLKNTERTNFCIFSFSLLSFFFRPFPSTCNSLEKHSLPPPSPSSLSIWTVDEVSRPRRKNAWHGYGSNEMEIKFVTSVLLAY